MAHRTMVFKGSTKSLYEGDTVGTYVLHFRDELRPGDSSAPTVIEGKGVLNNRFSEFVMTGLKNVGIPTHLVRRLNLREQSVRAAEILPVRVQVRNFATASFARRFGVDEGMQLSRPVVEFYLKFEDLNYPLVTEEHLSAFGWVSPVEFDEIIPLALRTNDFLTGMMAAVGIKLVDFVMEVGRVWEDEGSRLVIVDELSPEVCNLWDNQTDRKLGGIDAAQDPTDKFEGYREVAARLKILPESGLRLIKRGPDS